MAEIVVREAVGDGDVALVRALMEAYGEYLAGFPSGAQNMCLSGFRQELEGLWGKYSALLLAVVDGVPAGCVALRRMSRVEGGCEMKRLWVESKFRGLGLGRRLVEDAILWARRAGMKAMYLDTVSAAMPQAKRLYGSMGFEQIEPYHGDCTTDVEFFRLSLVADDEG
jgi:GNAT superfamily N-acetyltransferase